MTLQSGLEIPTEKIAEICRRYGIQEMAVFGSAARNDMRPDSDVDIMVEFFPGVVHGWEYFQLEEELAETFGEAAARIAAYAASRTAEDFMADQFFQDAVLRQLT